MARVQYTLNVLRRHSSPFALNETKIRDDQMFRRQMSSSIKLFLSLSILFIQNFLDISVDSTTQHDVTAHDLGKYFHVLLPK